jgi:hypothetical protein
MQKLQFAFTPKRNFRKYRSDFLDMTVTSFPRSLEVTDDQGRLRVVMPQSKPAGLAFFVPQMQFPMEIKGQ